MRYWFYTLCLVFWLTACGKAEDTSPQATNTLSLSPTTAIAESTRTGIPAIIGTTAPTSTPMTTNDLPAIELLSASPNSCRITEPYGQLAGYQVIYYQLTTTNWVVVTLTDTEGNVLGKAETAGENRDGAENWGWYPPETFDLPENSALTIELVVHSGGDSTTPITSRSQLTFDCTTGKALATNFERLP
jgi:hypothetical protein